MGRTKWYSEPESNGPQQGTRPAKGASRLKNASISPKHLVYDAPDSMSLSTLFRLVLLRIRRNWVALRFQINRYTFGAFKKQTALKLGFLVAATYAIMSFEGESGLFSEVVFRDGNEETSMDLSKENGISKPVKQKIKAKPKGDAAPVSAGDMANETADEYIDHFSKVAIVEMKKFGIPASISLAQGLIESRAGSSKLAERNNNHFGIKCFSRNCKAGHCTNFTDDSHKDFFRSFKNPWESWRAHSQMISSGRYAKLKKYGRDYKKWAYGLKSVGYATDETYAQKLIGVIERYDLHRFDR